MTHETISPFFALLSHLPKIDRWNKSKSIDTEYLSTHSLQVAMFTLTLAMIEKKLDHSFEDCPYELAVAAMFHDASEVISEDVNGLYKKMSPRIAELTKELEQEACSILLETIPVNLKDDFESLIFQKQHISKKGNDLIKAADDLSALAKAKEELRCGNLDFKTSANRLNTVLKEKGLKYKSVSFFLNVFMPAFDSPIDDMVHML